MKTNNLSNSKTKVYVDSQVITIGKVSGYGETSSKVSFALKKPVSVDNICVTVSVLHGTAYWTWVAASFSPNSFAIDSANNFTFTLVAYNNQSETTGNTLARVCVVY
jgi:hypothetical protein